MKINVRKSVDKTRYLFTCTFTEPLKPENNILIQFNEQD